MRSLFLLFVCILFLCLIKTAPPKQEKLERVVVERDVTIHFNGNLFLPKTIQMGEEKVNSSFVILTVAGKKYRYVKCYNNFCLSGVAKEVPVVKGDKISSTVPVNLFIAKEIE